MKRCTLFQPTLQVLVKELQHFPVKDVYLSRKISLSTCFFKVAFSAIK